MDKETLKSILSLDKTNKILTPELPTVAVINDMNSLKNLEQYCFKPNRVRGSYRLREIDSLVRFVGVECQKHGIQNPNFFVDTDYIRAIINHDSWGDFSAMFPLNKTKEYRNWDMYNEDNMNQRDFVDFIEDNMKDIVQHELPNGTKTISSSELQTVAQNFQQKTNAVFKSSYRASDGQTELSYAEDKDSSASKTLKVPDMFYIQIPIIEGAEDCTTYLIKVILKTRVIENKLVFSYKLVRPDIPVRESYNDLRNKLDEFVSKDTANVLPADTMIFIGGVINSPCDFK